MLLRGVIAAADEMCCRPGRCGLVAGGKAIKEKGCPCGQPFHCRAAVRRKLVWNELGRRDRDGVTSRGANPTRGEDPAHGCRRPRRL